MPRWFKTVGKKKHKKLPTSVPTPKERNWSWRSLGALTVTFVGALFTYTTHLPSIGVEGVELTAPMAPNKPSSIHGVFKNYGSTTARDFAVEAIMAPLAANVRAPRPFDKQAFEPKGFEEHDSVPINLPSGQSYTFDQRDPTFTPSDHAYSDVMSGKQKVLFAAKITYRDILYIPHTEIFCYAYRGGMAGNPLAFTLCEKADTV